MGQPSLDDEEPLLREAKGQDAATQGATLAKEGQGRATREASRMAKVSAALFYALASIMIMLVNKQVLTGFKFPSFQILGIGQMLSTIVVLQILSTLKYITLPNFTVSTLSSIWPLPLFYVGNMVFGLGGTKALSLPMLTVLRRFSILMLMVGEYLFLDIRAPFNVQASVGCMIGGAMVAAANDLAFNLQGYIFVLVNNVCTSGTGIVTKMKLNANSIGKYGLMYYNALLMLPPTLLVSYQTGDLERAYNFEDWVNPAFTLLFALSCVFGFILMYSTLLCTQYNSPLTTSIIGSLKNIFITYMGMVFGGDYIFTWWNFIGVTISAAASIMYTKVTFTNKIKAKESPVKEKRKIANRHMAVIFP